MSKKSLSTAILLIIIPLILVISWHMGDRKYYLCSIILIICAIGAFWLSFEQKSPKTREIVMVAVMCAIAVASRTVFIMLPQFKPMAAIVMICGMALGARAGFVTGTISVFVSNFIFGHGPWTLWQMFAFGLAGFIAGVLYDKGIMKKEKRISTALIGGAIVMLVVGPILDTCTVFTMSSMINMSSAAAVYLAGIPFNVVHSAATAITMFVLCRTMIEKLERIKLKYGIYQ